MSILDDIDVALDTGTNFVTRNKIFDVLFDDMIKQYEHAININRGLYPHLYPHNNFIHLSKEGCIRQIVAQARHAFSSVKMYELLDNFGLDIDELKTFLDSKYMYYIPHVRSYNVELGTSLDFNTNIAEVFEYLNNPEFVTRSYFEYSGYCNRYRGIRGYDDRWEEPYTYDIYNTPEYNYFAESFRKQVLGLELIINGVFWTEFKEYIENKPYKWYD